MTEPRKTPIKWMFRYAFFMRHGNCWSIFELPRMDEFYSGNSRTFSWWRFAITFDRREWMREGDDGHAEMVTAFKARLARHRSKQEVQS